MTAYYNEIEPYAAEWLRNLIKAGLIPDGEVDTRSIVDVSADDLRSFTQCHFFAGIGGWAHALRLAGWPDDRPIWTGSCPCQPFSVAGKQLGTDDPRHLWPHFFRLIRASRPPVVMGEQVAGAAGYGWFDGVAFDLESEDYASRAVDIPACAVNAPHIRSRLYWVASDVGNADSAGGASRIVVASGAEARSGQSVGSGVRSHMADAKHCAGGQFNGDPREVAGPQGSSEGKEPEARGSTQTSRHSRSRGHGDVADARREQAHQEQQRPQQNEGEWGSDGFGGCRVDHGQGYMADAGCRRDERGSRPSEAHGEAGAAEGEAQQRERGRAILGDSGAGSLGGNSHMADADSPAEQRGWRGFPETEGQEAGWDDNRSRGAGSFGSGDMADAEQRHCGRETQSAYHEPPETDRPSNQYSRCGRPSSFWSEAIWLTGADGKARRAEPTIPLLAHGIPARVGRLRAYGNAIVPQVAAEVIAAFMEEEACQPRY